MHHSAQAEVLYIDDDAIDDDDRESVLRPAPHPALHPAHPAASLRLVVLWGDGEQVATVALWRGQGDDPHWLLTGQC